ncbi:hypothetical protein BJ165DRAFT_33338 [Panaeolus papilionaceus]|nr:hypothetical protein BJ165DRAFT_33338 [Panaeolus papilionaceus]
MSRHRAIRNLNIQAELDDDAFSEPEEDQLTEEQQAQMNDGLEQIRQVIGSADFSGVSDQSIKDALWEYYFDVDQTIQWAMDEQERRRIAKEKKDEWRESDDQEEQVDEAYVEQDYVQSRLPSIFRAQQQPDFDQEAYQWVDPTPGVPQVTNHRLSTITEKTERTEPSTMWQSRRMYSSNRQSFLSETETISRNTPRGPMASLPSSPTTSYGRELGSRDSLQDLSILAPRREPEPELSNASTFTPEHLPEIQEAPPVERAASLASQTDDKRPASKLSKLASSRTSTVSLTSQSSRSSGVALTGSVKTFPVLRPSAQSMKPPSSIASPSSALSKSLPPLPGTPTATPPPSEFDSIVRKAIASALQSEANDGQQTPTNASDRSATPTPTESQPKESPKSPQQSRPQSKLALLAQRKLESAHARTPPPPSTHLSETVPSIAPRPPSKLALLAQQKIDASRVPKLPKTTTEYLTPIANGASVTTAITTSYQSLYSITDPNSPSFLPKLEVVPIQLNAADSSAPVDIKRSKLAMKVKRGETQQPMSPAILSAGEISSFGSPLFHSSNRARASPSAFASVLIHDNIILYEGKGTEADRQETSPKKKKKKAQRSPEFLSDHEHGSPTKLKSKNNIQAATLSGRQHKPSFAFDVPSPDDIVLNARKGTKLGAIDSSTSRSTQDSGKLSSRA